MKKPTNSTTEKLAAGFAMRWAGPRGWAAMRIVGTPNKATVLVELTGTDDTADAITDRAMVLPEFEDAKRDFAKSAEMAKVQTLRERLAHNRDLQRELAPRCAELRSRSLEAIDLDEGNILSDELDFAEQDQRRLERQANALEDALRQAHANARREYDRLMQQAHARVLEDAKHAREQASAKLAEAAGGALTALLLAHIRTNLATAKPDAAHCLGPEPGKVEPVISEPEYGQPGTYTLCNAP